MTIVVDANVALKWFVPQSESETALQLHKTASLIAPGMLVSEVTSTLWRYADQHHLSGDRARSALNTLPRFFAEFVDDRSLAAPALDIALDLGYPPYDFFYVALAMARDARVVTADKRPVNRLTGTRYRSHVTLLSDWKP